MPVFDHKSSSRTYWHRKPVGCDDAHDDVTGLGEALAYEDRERQSINSARMRVYEGTTIRRTTGLVDDAAVARLNAIKSICDTFASRLAKDRPMPSIITDDGAWRQKRKASLYRAFVVGQMMETEFDDLSVDALRDGTVLGNGITRIDDAGESVFAERMPVSELLLDRRECKYAKPRSAMRVSRIARDHLCELFPDAKAAIMNAAPSESQLDDDRALDLDDYVDAYEAWHLPTTSDSEDGRHALCIRGATLVFDEWCEPRFPWAMFTLDKPMSGGLWGKGFVDLLISLQHRVNLIVRDIQLNLSATGRGHYLMHEASAVPGEMLNADAPFTIKYRGNAPPQWNAPTPFNPAQMGAADKFIQWMYDLSGVSRASAESKSALGAGASGVALDTQYDIDSDRFRLPQRNYARYRLDGAQRYIDAAKRVARRRAEGKGKKRSWVAVSWKNRDAISRLEFGKVELEDDSYRLQIEPVNFLPDTRAGKLAVVEQLAKAGVIPPWLVPTLFDDPDLQQANSISLAAFRNAIRKWEILDDEDAIPPVPEPYNDVELEHRLMVSRYNMHQADNAPEEVLDRYRVYIDLLAEEMKKNIAASAPPAEAALPEPAMAPPMPGLPMPQPMPQMVM